MRILSSSMLLALIALMIVSQNVNADFAQAQYTGTPQTFGTVTVGSTDTVTAGAVAINQLGGSGSLSIRENMTTGIYRPSSITFTYQLSNDGSLTNDELRFFSTSGPYITSDNPYAASNALEIFGVRLHSGTTQSARFIGCTTGNINIAAGTTPHTIIITPNWVTNTATATVDSISVGTVSFTSIGCSFNGYDRINKLIADERGNGAKKVAATITNINIIGQNIVNNTLNGSSCTGGQIGSPPDCQNPCYPTNTMFGCMIDDLGTKLLIGAEAASWLIAFVLCGIIIVVLYKMTGSAIAIPLGGFMGLGLCVGTGIVLNDGATWVFMTVTFLIIGVVAHMIFGGSQQGDE